MHGRIQSHHISTEVIDFRIARFLEVLEGYFIASVTEEASDILSELVSGDNSFVELGSHHYRFRHNGRPLPSIYLRRRGSRMPPSNKISCPSVGCAT